MNRDTAILTATVAGTTVGLLALGAFFMDTGNKTAGYLLMGSPVLVGIGVLLMKRGMVSMSRYSLPLQLKSRELASFAELYNKTESRFASSARMLGVKRDDLPSLAAVRKPLGGHLTEDSAGRVHPNERRQDALDLSVVNKQRSQLVALSNETESAIRGRTDGLLASAAPILGDLRKMGLVDGDGSPPRSSASAHEDLHGAHAWLAGAASSAQQALGEAIEAVTALYKDTTAETSLAAQGKAALDGHSVVAALAAFRDAGRSLEGKLKNEFGKKRNDVLRAVVVLTEAGRKGTFSPNVQDRIKKLERAADRLRSPLQLSGLGPLRSEALEVARQALAEVEQRTRDTASDAWDAYAAKHGPADLHGANDDTMGDVVADWQARIESLTSGLTASMRDAKLRPLYRKLLPTIEATLLAKGVVTPEDLKLRDAQALFEQYVAETGRGAVQGGSLVLAGQAPGSAKPNAAKAAPTKPKPAKAAARAAKEEDDG